MSNIRINPTFSLKGINPKVLHDNYINGATTNIKLEDFSNNHINSVDSIELDYPIGESSRSEIYEYKDTCNIRIFTTNHTDYIRFSSSTSSSVASVHQSNNHETKCKVCGDECNNPLGIPFYMDVEIDSNGNKHITFYIEDTNYCSFEHMLYVLNNHNFNNKKEVEYYIRMMFHLMHPNEKMPTSSSDTSILTSYNGPVKVNDYKKHHYVPIPGLVFSHSKRQFIQM